MVIFNSLMLIQSLCLYKSAAECWSNSNSEPILTNFYIQNNVYIRIYVAPRELNSDYPNTVYYLAAYLTEPVLVRRLACLKNVFGS